MLPPAVSRQVSRECGGSSGDRSQQLMPNDNVSPGETYIFSGGERKISLVLGCQKESNRYIYPIRLYPTDA